jgi:hypothetical protein
MNPTVSSNQKRHDIFSATCLDIKLRVNSSKSVEKVVNKKKLLSKREEKEYSPKKLVYKSVRKLNTWMKKSKTKNTRETKHLKTILFHHINKNMKHMNLRVSGEIESPSISKFHSEKIITKLPQIENLGTEFQRIKVNHQNTGIMRRNKLLIEHIMHERIRNQQRYNFSVPKFQRNV